MGASGRSGGADTAPSSVGGVALRGRCTSARSGRVSTVVDALVLFELARTIAAPAMEALFERSTDEEPGPTTVGDPTPGRARPGVRSAPRRRITDGPG